MGCPLKSVPTIWESRWTTRQFVGLSGCDAGACADCADCAFFAASACLALSCAASGSLGSGEAPEFKRRDADGLEGLVAGSDISAFSLFAQEHFALSSVQRFKENHQAPAGGIGVAGGEIDGASAVVGGLMTLAVNFNADLAAFII